MRTSQFVDKQIMDLSSLPSTGNSILDFLDLANPRQDLAIGGSKKEEIVPSYEFHPIRPIGSSSPPLSNADSSNVGGAKAWNSADSQTNTASIRNYGPLESKEPAKVIVEKNESRFDSTLISEIDHTLKKYTDNLLHALEDVSARMSQLETRTRQIENSVDDLKLSVGNTSGGTDGKLRQLENIVREVHTEVRVIRDKQEIVEAKLQVAKLQVSKVEGDQTVGGLSTLPIDSLQPSASVSQHPHHHQQSFPAALAPPSQFLPPLDAPPRPPQQNLPSQVQIPNQFSVNQIYSVPQHGQTPEIPSQLYQMPSSQQIHPSPSPQPPPPPQYQSAPQLQYSQPSLPTPSHTASPSVNPSRLPQPQPSLGHHTEDLPFIPHQGYPPSLHKTPSQSSASGALSQQFYGAAPNMYELQSRQPGPGLSSAYGPSSEHGEPYPHSSSISQYGNGSPRKSQQLPATMNQSGGSGYPQLPTAKILPQALPTPSAVGGSLSSIGSGNRVPIDDVVDKVTNMGFPRDHVRATVRKLTDNGQAVDLNVVLDKLMNDGEVQPPLGWFGR